MNGFGFNYTKIRPIEELKQDSAFKKLIQQENNGKVKH